MAQNLEAQRRAAPAEEAETKGEQAPHPKPKAAPLAKPKSNPKPQPQAPRPQSPPPPYPRYARTPETGCTTQVSLFSPTFPHFPPFSPISPPIFLALVGVCPGHDVPATVHAYLDMHIVAWYESHTPIDHGISPE